MKNIKRTLFLFFSTFLYTAIGLLVLGALALSIARISLPVVENYKTDIETWLSDYIGQQIEIATFDAVWYGLEPQLVLKGVQLLSEDRMSMHGYFQDARLGLNLLASIKERRFIPGAFTIEGARFGVVRGESGDIAIQGVNPTDGAANADSSKLLSDWIFNQRLFDIRNSEIVWKDDFLQKPSRLFRDVNLRFINENNRHLIKGSVKLPKQFGAAINVALDVKGNLLTADGWDGDVYIETQGLSISEAVDEDKRKDTYVSDGLISLRLWSHWKAAKISSVKGDVDVSRLVLTSPQNAKHKRIISHVKSKFFAEQIDEAWQGVLSDFSLGYRNKYWPESTASFVFNKENEFAQVALEYVDVSDLLSLSKIVTQVDLSKIEKLAPRGVLHDINVIYDGQLALGAKLRGFSNNPQKFIPGLKSLDAELYISPQVAFVGIKNQDVKLRYPRVYKQDSQVRGLSANLYFEKGESDWSLVVNDVELGLKKTKANGSLALSYDKNMSSPLLDLSFDLQGGNLADAQYYIPGNIMKSNAVSWIKKSLIRGELKNAKIIHYGNVRKYPYKNNEGAFVVEIGLEKGVLEFAESWPQIEKINGVYKMNSRSFQFFANSASSLNNSLENIYLELPDFFSDPTLNIQGTIRGNTKDKLYYLHHSPLEKMFAKALAPLGATGSSTVDLNLSIPLKDVRSTQANGVLQLTENHLFSEQLKLDLKEVGGSFVFSNSSFGSELIRAKIFDTAINGEIETLDVGDERQLQIRAIGMFDSQSIKSGIDTYVKNAKWSRLIEGKSRVEATLSIPFKPKEEVGSKVKIQLASNLKGLSVDLPSPLKKNEEEQISFALDMDLSGDARQLGILYGDYNVLLEARASDKLFKIEKGGIGLMQTAKLPVEYGFHFSGRLPKLYWSEWSAFLFPVNPEHSIFEKGMGASLFFDVTIGEAEIFNKVFEDLRIHASQSVEFWTLRLSGPQILGDAKVPLDADRVPLSINFKKLYIDKSLAKETEKAAIDPEKLFNINLDIEDFRYKNIRLGHLKLKTSSIEAGKKIESASLAAAGSDLTFTGQWVNKSEGIQQTNIRTEINAKNFGATLDSWDFKDVMQGGMGEITLDTNWNTDPMSFEFGNLNGIVKADLADASLLDFDIGAARLFTVMLPRRLLLDFRDVAKEGLFFDSIKGQYKIQSGEAFTDNLSLKGPVADLKIAGQVGLTDKSFDKVVTVNRRLLGDSIPIVGTVLAADPILSGSLFVFKKLFEKQIDDILSVQYTVEGTWGAPVIKPVEKAPDPGVESDLLLD